MFGTVIAASVATVAATLVTGARMVGFKRILRNATLVDVGFTVGMGVAFAGTLTGLLVAIVAGLFMALFLTGCNKVLPVIERRKSATCAPAKTVQKHGLPDDEFTADGVWLYNSKPYI